MRKNYSKRQDGDPLVITVKLKMVLTTSGHFGFKCKQIDPTLAPSKLTYLG